MNPSDYLLKRCRIFSQTSCWNWQRFVRPDGYGRARINGTDMYAHRAAYHVFVGDIPYELHVLHKCDNRSCINPAHLFLSTHADNMRDAVDKNRQCKGQTRPDAKLAYDDVVEIRHRYAMEKISHRKLAQEYGVNHRTIGRILTRESWV